jgi:hypothetical protein
VTIFWGPIFKIGPFFPIMCWFYTPPTLKRGVPPNFHFLAKKGVRKRPNILPFLNLGRYTPGFFLVKLGVRKRPNIFSFFQFGALYPRFFFCEIGRFFEKNAKIFQKVRKKTPLKRA